MTPRGLLADALRLMSSLLADVTGLRSASARIGLLSCWGPPLRRHGGYSAIGCVEERGGGGGGHFLQHIESCGPRARQAVAREFAQLYGTLLRQLTAGARAAYRTCVHVCICMGVTVYLVVALLRQLTCRSATR